MMKHRLALVLLTAAFFTASCGGGNSPLPTSSVDASTGTGTVPLYQSSAELLTLPMLKVAGNIQTDVKLQVKKDGSWALLSSGPVRAATASDAPPAALAAPGSTLDLGSGQTDATLTVARLHVEGRVFGNVALRLTGKTWAFAGTPQEVKTLHLEDFKSNTAIRADESNHVVLKSNPTTGVQNVPMQLSTRSYRFCMDAQAEGADSTTLLDAAGNTVFALKAGEPCVTINAREGAYTLQHRYGGTGSARTVFMRHQANTTTAALAAVRATMPKMASLLAASTTYPEKEYWSVRRAALTPGDPDFYVYLGVTPRNSANYPNVGAIFCSDPLTFAYADQWQANTFIGIDTNVFNTTMQLAQPLACTNAQLAQTEATHTYISVVGDPKIRSFPVYRDEFGYTYISYYPLTQSADGRTFPSYFTNMPASDPQYSVASLTVASLTGNQFNLFTTQTRDPSTEYAFDRNGLYIKVLRPAETTSGPVISNLDGTIAVGNAATDIAKPMAIGFRYFPGGLASTVAPGVGQVALFTGANCSGAAVITEAVNIPSFSASSMPGLQGLGASFQLGLQTSVTAFSLPLYNGESQVFDQLTCSSFGSAGEAPASMQVVVDIIDMVISTDACEYCNLAGVDFSGHDLTKVKLSHANLSGAVLSNIDLSGADLRFATLQGAVLGNSNLDGANLCGAQLNGSAAVAQAATLIGAHLRNTNLANANLDGVNLSSASFYSSGAGGACQQTSCDSYVAPTCASAYGASVNNANFDSAYLSNVDLGDITGVGVNFSNAALFGVSFVGADLSHNNQSSVSSLFNKTYLQGTDFSRATLKFADFTGAQFDMDSACIQANLAASYAQFPGSKVPASPGSASCVAGKPTAAFCTESIFAASPTYPPTDCTNLCPDGSRGGTLGPQNGSCSGTASCAVTSWAGAGNSAMPTSSCNGPAPLCGSAFSSTKNQCW